MKRVLKRVTDKAETEETELPRPGVLQALGLRRMERLAIEPTLPPQSNSYFKSKIHSQPSMYGSGDNPVCSLRTLSGEVGDPIYRTYFARRANYKRLAFLYTRTVGDTPAYISSHVTYHDTCSVLNYTVGHQPIHGSKRTGIRSPRQIEVERQCCCLRPNLYPCTCGEVQCQYSPHPNLERL